MCGYCGFGVRSLEIKSSSKAQGNSQHLAHTFSSSHTLKTQHLSTMKHI